MNKVEYLSALDMQLRSLPEQERKDALDFYYSYFEDALESGKTEEQIINELGSYEKIAIKIISESNFKAKSAASQEAFKKAGDNNSVFSGVKGIFLAIGAVFIALPGAFIIGFPLLMVVFALLIAAFSIVLSLCIVAIVVPIAFLIAGIGFFISVPMVGIAGVGMGLLFLGLGLLFGTLAYALVIVIIKGIAWIVTSILMRIEKKSKRKADVI
jgi:uncharacterized membrane protein